MGRIVTMAEIQAARKHQEQQHLRMFLNPERQFFKARGIRGKMKKKIRRLVRARQKTKLASANAALVATNADLVAGAIRETPRNGAEAGRQAVHEQRAFDGPGLP